MTKRSVGSDEFKDSFLVSAYPLMIGIEIINELWEKEPEMMKRITDEIKREENALQNRERVIKN